MVDVKNRCPLCLHMNRYTIDGFVVGNSFPKNRKCKKCHKWFDIKEALRNGAG